MTSSRAVTITDTDGGEEQIELPDAVVDLLVEDEMSTAEGIADLVVFACAQRIHAVVHHAEGNPDEGLETAEAAMMERFEERFGASYGEITGHQH